MSAAEAININTNTDNKEEKKMKDKKEHNVLDMSARDITAVVHAGRQTHKKAFAAYKQVWKDEYQQNKAAYLAKYDK